MLFQGKILQKELDRIKEEATYFGEEGSIDYTNTVVKVYAIRRKEGDHLFVQLSGYSGRIHTDSSITKGRKMMNHRNIKTHIAEELLEWLSTTGVYTKNYKRRRAFRWI